MSTAKGIDTVRSAAVFGSVKSSRRHVASAPKVTISLEAFGSSAQSRRVGTTSSGLQPLRILPLPVLQSVTRGGVRGAFIRTRRCKNDYCIYTLAVSELGTYAPDTPCFAASRHDVERMDLTPEMIHFKKRFQKVSAAL